MSHELTSSDTMFSVRQRPWHGLGTILDRPPVDVRDALLKAGLDWRVAQEPVHLPDGCEIPGFRANLRSDTGDVLGIVTDAYKVVQNHEALGFLAGLIGSEVSFETAGSVRGGRQVWALCALPDHLEIGGDAVAQYLFAHTAHDGSAAVSVKPTDIRVVCQNTIRAALHNGRTAYRFRHTANASVQLHEARQALQLAVDYGRALKRVGDGLALQAYGERELRRTLEQLYPSGTTDRQATSARKARDTIVHLFLDGETVGNAPDTKWCALNAIVEYDQHHRAVRTKDPALAAERRFVRAVADAEDVGTRALLALAG